VKSLIVSEQFAPKGRIIVRGYGAGAIAIAQPLADEFMRCQRQLPTLSGWRRERMMRTLASLRQCIDGIFESRSLGIEAVSDNLIMTGSLTGRDLLVQYLINGTTYSGGLNYGALGTSITTPASSDTQLGAEVARAPFSTAIDVSNNQAQFQFYLPDANLANGSYQEAGTFMNGSASLNSGQIFNHGLLGTTYTKTSGTDTTLAINI
jgi:hypothetical protein